MVGTETEDVFVNALPDGFKTTFKDSDRLRRLLSKANSNASLDGVVEDYNNFSLTERDIIIQQADRVNTAFLLPERTIELPGLQLALDDTLFKGGKSLLELFALLYRDDANTPTGTITDAARATTDDLVFTLATPEVFNQINSNGGTVENFRQTALTAGNTLEVVGQGGIDTSVNTAGNSLTLADDEMLFFTGDYIDLSDGKSVITKIELPDVDGEDFGPTEFLLRNRLSGAHLGVAQGFYATDTVDVDAKIYDDGDAELFPVAFYMADGSKAPSLT